MATLKNEGLVGNLEGKVRVYEILDSNAFMAQMNALMVSEVDLKVANIPANYKTSYAIKKSVLPITKSATAIKVKNLPRMTKHPS